MESATNVCGFDDSKQRRIIADIVNAKAFAQIGIDIDSIRHEYLILFAQQPFVSIAKRSHKTAVGTQKKRF
jgi:hypothetical protein